MNSICGICCFGINEGSVCRDCREKFRAICTDTAEFQHCLQCNHCDVYYFPCRCCAKHAFNGVLGCGSGYCQGSINKPGIKPLQLEEIVKILEVKGGVILEDFDIYSEEITETRSEEIVTETRSEEIVTETRSEEIGTEEIGTETRSEEIGTETRSEEIGTETRSEEIVTEEIETRSETGTDEIVTETRTETNTDEIVTDVTDKIVIETETDDTITDVTDEIEIVIETDEIVPDENIVPDIPKKKGYFSWIKSGAKKIMFLG